MIREFLVILRLHSWFRIEMSDKNCWTDEMHQFLIENYEKIDYAELAEIMSKRFGRTVSKYAIYGRLRYLREKRGYQLNKKPPKRKALWTKEMDAVLLDNYLDMRYVDLAVMISEKFGVHLSAGSIARRVHELKKVKAIQWTKQMDSFLIENYVNIGPIDLAPMMSKLFHVKFTAKSLHQRAQRLDIRINTMNCPIGTEHVVGKFVRVKVHNLSHKERKNWHDNWMAKQRYVWEQAYGPIPEDHCIIFADGNNRNYELSNLRCIPIKYRVLMVKQLSNDIFKEGPEMIDAAIAWCKLHYAIKETKEKE